MGHHGARGGQGHPTGQGHGTPTLIYEIPVGLFVTGDTDKWDTTGLYETQDTIRHGYSAHTAG